MSDCPFDTRLYRTAYLVLPKLAIQSMPMEWRNRLSNLLLEAEAMGLKTPDYHVLREGGAYTAVEKYDVHDANSRDYEFTAVGVDPWADYRRGNIEELCPTFRKDNPPEFITVVCGDEEATLPVIDGKVIMPERFIGKVCHIKTKGTKCLSWS